MDRSQTIFDGMSEIRDAMIAMNGGYKIVESLHLTETLTKPRDWRERLFSWPWRPWVRFKTEDVPYRGAVRIGDNTLLMHPVTVQALRKEVNRGKI